MSPAGPALSRCNRCSCIGPRAIWGPEPWCLGRVFIFSDCWRVSYSVTHKQWIWFTLCYAIMKALHLTCHSVTHKHERWIWFTLSYAMMKAVLRLAAVRDTKQAGELRGYTVQFIASSSALVIMTQNGSIYRPLTQTATCLLRRYRSKHIAENS